MDKMRDSGTLTSLRRTFRSWWKRPGRTVDRIEERRMVEGAGHFGLYWMPQYVDPAVEGISEFLKKQIQ